MSILKGLKSRKREAGLTLIELLVVLVIIGLISALVVPQVIGYVGRARTDTAAVQVERLAGVLDLYRLDVGSYPSQDEGLAVLVAAPSGNTRWRGPYIDKPEALLDPWGVPYGYRVPGETGAFDIFSLGADGQPGGEGEDADVAY